MYVKSFIIFLFLILHTGISIAGELSGFIAAEHRQFFSSEQFSGQKEGSVPSLIIEPEYISRSENGDHSFIAKLFYRYDPVDAERSHFDVRQADWTYANNDWELRVGMSRVFWGVIESRKLVDTLNQVDAVEDVDEEDRLGQAMFQFASFHDWGTLRAFYLPYFRERTFPGREGRLRPAVTVDDDAARYEENAEEWYPNIALRYEHYFGNWDIGLAQFHGTGREPVFQFENGLFVPFYETINQTSLDLQYTNDAWLVKLESLYREGQGDSFIALSGGVEYTLFGIFETDHDLGLLVEYHHDGRDEEAPITFFDDDVFIGFRYVLNNISDTEILAGVTMDTRGNGSISVVEASHRINEHLKIEADARMFNGIDSNTQFAFLNNDDFAQIRLSYYF